MSKLADVAAFGFIILWGAVYNIVTIPKKIYQKITKKEEKDETVV